MLVYDPATNPLNTNEWAFPLTEVVHIAAMAFSIGTIAMVDLRMLGLGLTSQASGGLVRDTELWTLSGFVVVITSGLLIFSSDPVHYAADGVFRLKMALLLFGILFNYTVHRTYAKSAPSPAGALVAGFSLLIWVSVVFSGIFIAFV